MRKKRIKRVKSKKIKIIRKELEAKSNLIYIVCNVPQKPWKAVWKALLSHEGLTADDAWSLLEVVKTPEQRKRLVDFLWNVDREAFFETIRCHGSLEAREAAWDLLQEKAKSVKIAGLAEYLMKLIKDDPSHRKNAWNLIKKLSDFPETQLQKIAGLEGIEFWEIKNEARKMAAKKASGTSKNISAIIARSNKKREA